MSDYTNPVVLSDLANLLAPHLIDRLGIDNRPKSAPVSTSLSGGSSGPGTGVSIDTVNDLLNAHAAKGYSTGHAQDPDTGIYLGVHWGITGGTEDQSQRLIDMLNDVGANGGGHIVLRSRIPTDPLVFRKLTSIYHDNITLEFKSPQVFGKVGGLRIMGSMDEYTRESSPGVFLAAGKLRANANIGDTVLLLKSSPSSMQASDFLDGDYIVVRGLNGVDGNALQKQYFYVLSRDLINNNLNLSSEVEEGPFQPTYTTGDSPIDHSDWPDDATTGTTIYIVRNGQFLTNVSRGMYSFDVTNIANFKIGQLVRIADSRNENDMNPSAIRSSGLPYENECNMEFAKVINVVPIGAGPTGTITIDHAISKNYLAGAPYYGGISVVKPVKNTKIMGLNVTYDEIQESKNDHAVTVAFAEDCHVQYGAIYGAKYDPTTHALLAGRWGQALRFSDCYGCSGSNLLIEDAAASGSGEGYGATIYKSTGVVLRNIIARGCRHNFLVQAATLFVISDCESWGDRISGFDLHGALEYDGVIQNCRAIRSNEHTGDANNGAGFRAGNTSHTPGSWYMKFINCTATGYQETNCAGFDFLPNSFHIDIVACHVYGAYYGLTFTRNSSQVTPVQDVESIRIFGCVFADCTDRAVRIIGAPTYAPPASNGKVLNLSIKQCATVRCSRHYVIDGNDGVSNLTMEGCEVLEPIALAGEYAYDIEGVLGFVRFRNNSGAGANRGVKFTNCDNVLGHSNTMTPTVESIPFTDGGGNVALAYIDPFDPLIGATANHLIATANTIVGTGVKGTYIQGAGTDGVITWVGYTGFGAYWDGVNWKIGTDGVTNGAYLIIATGSGDALKSYKFPSTGGTVQTIAPASLATYLDTSNVVSYISLSAPSVLSGALWKGTHSQGAGTDGVRTWAGYTGYNIYWNGTVWQIGADGGSNGASLVLAYGSGEILQTFSFPTVGTTPRTILPANLESYLVSPSAGNSVFTTDIWSQANTPRFTLWENDAALNEKRVNFQMSAGTLQVRFVSDDGLSANSAWTFTRSGIVPLLLEVNAAATINGALTATGFSTFGDRTRFKTGVSGSAGMWLATSGGTDRMFMGLVEDDATPIWGIWSGGYWQFSVSHDGKILIANNVAGAGWVAGKALNVWGPQWMYQNSTDWAPIQMRGADGTHYSRIQAVGDSNTAHSAIVFQQVTPTGAGAPLSSRIYLQTMESGILESTIEIYNYGMGVNVNPGSTATLYVNSIDLAREGTRILAGTAANETTIMLHMMWTSDWGLKFRQKHIGGSRITYEMVYRQNAADLSAIMIDSAYGGGGLGIWNNSPKASFHLKMLADAQSGMAVQYTTAVAGAGNVTILASGTVGYSINNPVCAVHGVARHSVNGVSLISGAFQSGTNYVHTNAGGSTLTFSVTTGGEVRVAAAGAGNWTIVATYTYT